MALPQFFVTYLQAVWDATRAIIKPGDITVGNLPALDIAAWSPLGLAANADGSAATLDAAAYRANLKTHLDALGYVVGSTAPAATQLAAPGSPQASASSATAISVTASSVANATGYRLFRSPAGANTFTQLGGTLPTPAYSDTGLTASTTYDYQEQAVGNGTSYSDSPRSATFSGTTSAAATPAATPPQATPLTQAKVVLQRNAAVTNSDLAGVDGVAGWALTTSLTVAAGVDGYVDHVLTIPAGVNVVGGLVILNPGTALPSGATEYLNTHGIKKGFAANGPFVATEGAGANYPAVTQANGDIVRVATVGAQVVYSISHDNRATFTTIATTPRHQDTAGAITPLTLMLAGEAANVIHSVTYYNFS